MPHHPRHGELREAASKGDVVEVRALLRAGADCDDNLADEDGDTALMWASEKGHRDVAELLVGEGADVNQATFYVSNLKLWLPKGGVGRAGVRMGGTWRLPGGMEC